MKITPTNSYHSTHKKELQTPSPHSKKVTFGNVGAAGGYISNGVVQFFEAIERGGFAASFILNDTISATLPRTIMGSMRGTEKSGGKKNWAKATEELLRELLTGPSMFLVPGVVLSAAAKMTGKANNVPLKSIDGFAKIMSGTSGYGDLRRSFYEHSFRDLAKYTFDESSAPIDIKEYADMLLKTEKKGVPKRTFWQKFKNLDPHKGQALDQQLENIANKFISDKKLRVQYSQDFTTAKISKYADETNISKILKQMQDFADDAIEYTNLKRSGRGISSVMEEFKNLRSASRFITNPVVFLATGAFLSVIPKIYSFNKTDPGTAALYAQIGENRKGPTNANI